jgi:D-alanine-D-alanine ligase-like ATP-grasp enzyme
MERVSIGIVRGGTGPEYEESLLVGGYIIKHMPHSFRALDILITKDGVWHMWGIPATPEQISRNVDIFFNALVGSGEEEHGIQRMIEHFGKPYIGSSALSRSVVHTRHLAREAFSQLGIKTPYHRVTYTGKNPEEIAQEIFNTVPPPWRMRFSNEISSNITREARSYEELLETISYLQNFERPIIVEEHIQGEGATCYVIEGSEGEYHTFCVGGYDPEELVRLSNKAHEGMRLSHFSKTNFIVSPRRGTYLTSMYAYPDLSPHSLLVKKLSRDGIKSREYIDHLISLCG